MHYNEQAVLELRKTIGEFFRKETGMDLFEEKSEEANRYYKHILDLQMEIARKVAEDGTTNNVPHK